MKNIKYIILYLSLSTLMLGFSAHAFAQEDGECSDEPTSPTLCFPEINVDGETLPLPPKEEIYAISDELVWIQEEQRDIFLGASRLGSNIQAPGLMPNDTAGSFNGAREWLRQYTLTNKWLIGNGKYIFSTLRLTTDDYVSMFVAVFKDGDIMFLIYDETIKAKNTTVSVNLKRRWRADFQQQFPAYVNSGDTIVIPSKYSQDLHNFFKGSGFNHGTIKIGDLTFDVAGDWLWGYSNAHHALVKNF